jgi:tRNA dimethylallyltransferase
MIIVLAGATAVGKSSLAIALAQRLSGTILVADSMQVYKGMNIGTAKPTSEDQSRIPHGGIDQVEPDHSYSVADYLKAAQAHIQKYSQRPLIVCGGTGLYLKALREGLAFIPPIPQALKDELQSMPLEALQRKLIALDPHAAAKIDIKNPVRVARALGVVITTGQSILFWHAQKQSMPLLPPETHYYWIQRTPDEEKKRIEDRIHAMLASGWIAETQDLLNRYPPKAILSHAAIGYGLIARWLLEGNPDLSSPPSTLIEAILFATRQYRKRQHTWFKKERCWKNLIVSGITVEIMVDKILKR